MAGKLDTRNQFLCSGINDAERSLVVVFADFRRASGAAIVSG